MLEIIVQGIDQLTVDLSVMGANDPLLAYLYIKKKSVNYNYYSGSAKKKGTGSQNAGFSIKKVVCFFVN